MIRTFQTPTEYEIMFRECMKSQEIPGIVRNSRDTQEGNLHACGIFGRMETADHGLPGQRADSQRMVFLECGERAHFAPLHPPSPTCSRHDPNSMFNRRLYRKRKTADMFSVCRLFSGLSRKMICDNCIQLRGDFREVPIQIKRFHADLVTV